MARGDEWLTIGIVAFLGGVVSNIIVPVRRGIIGFVSAAMIGVFCGGVSGIVANSYDLHPGMQYAVAATVAVLGDRLLTSIMQWRLTKGDGKTTIINMGPSQNQFGENNSQDQL